MQLFDIISKLKSKTLPSFMVFTGSEYAIIDLYLNQIAKAYAFEKQVINNVMQIAKKQHVISLIGENKLYICKYDTDFTKTDLTVNQVCQRVGKNILVLVLSNIDKRSKFYKQFEPNIVEFNEQDDKTLAAMLSGKINISKSNFDRLLVGCGKNYSKILLEIDKIKTLSKVRNISENEAYEALIDDGSIYELQDTKLQQFVDCVMKKNTDCFKLYNSLINNGENNMTMIAWLYSAVRNQLSVQTTQKPSQETTGLNYFFIKECFDRQGYYTTKQLLKLLNIIKYTEQGIKSGLIEDINSVQYIMVNAL